MKFVLIKYNVANQHQSYKYTTEEFVVALSGSFDVVVNDGVNEYIYEEEKDI